MHHRSLAGGGAALVLKLTAVGLITPWAGYWAVLGCALHVGLALTVELGMFTFGMLALYPVLFGSWTLAALDRLAPWLPTGWGPPD
jgi:hypothetical protein